MIRILTNGTYNNTQEGKKKWYDTAEGIEKSLNSLGDLWRLVQVRRTAGYIREEVLQEFYILGGRFFFDKCGNFTKLSEVFLKDILPLQIPRIMDRDDFWEYVKEHLEEGKHIRLAYEYGGMNIPAPTFTCPICGNGWDVENCYDAIERRAIHIVNLDEFVGQPLKNVWLYYAKKEEAEYTTDEEYIIIQEHQDENDSTKKVEKWLNWMDGISGEYVIREGDKTRVLVTRMVHEKCDDIYVQEEIKKDFKELFEKAGFTVNNITPIRGKALGYAWMEVDTVEVGPVQLGYRNGFFVFEGDGHESVASDVIERLKK